MSDIKIPTCNFKTCNKTAVAHVTATTFGIFPCDEHLGLAQDHAVNSGFCVTERIDTMAHDRLKLLGLIEEGACLFRFPSNKQCDYPKDHDIHDLRRSQWGGFKYHKFEEI